MYIIFYKHLHKLFRNFFSQHKFFEVFIVVATKCAMELIRLHDVWLWRDSTVILKNIHLTIHQGEQWVVLGPNGAGKSFLMNIIATLVFPSKGEVIIKGNKLGEVNVWELRKHIGVVSDQLQSSYPKHIPAIEVVASGFHSSMGIYQELSLDEISKAEKILNTLGLAHIKNVPYGKLSHGEQKRVLIARALVYNPSILILDEPCGGLDIKAREEFLHFLTTLVKRNATIVYVTHCIDEIMPWINRVLLINDGQLIYVGDRSGLEDERLLSTVMGYQLGVFCHNGRLYWYIK